MCPPHIEFNATGDGTEYAKFLKTQFIAQLVSDVSQRLGFKFTLEIQQILDIFEYCRLDQAWAPQQPSAWCAAFTPAQIERLEYLEDLNLYYENGYGRPQNAPLKCAIVNDLLHHLETDGQPKAVAYFAHSHGLLLLLTALQAVKDADVLRADNYEILTDRKWRSSEIAPFAANLAVIKYECRNQAERVKVMFLLNEKPLHFDWCQDGLCNLEDVRKQYNKYTQVDCDEYYCSAFGAASTFRFAYISVLAPVMLRCIAKVLL